MDNREQRYAYVGVGLAIVASVALWAPAFGERSGMALAGIGLVMAALLGLAAKQRSRFFTGLACVLLAFGPWGMAWVIGLPYLMLAAWITLKSPRFQPRVKAEGVDGGDEEDTVEAFAAARLPREVPSANKRFTPPQRRP